MVTDNNDDGCRAELEGGLGGFSKLFSLFFFN
jgi:hypothetical protein